MTQPLDEENAVAVYPPLVLLGQALCFTVYVSYVIPFTSHRRHPKTHFYLHIR